MALPGSPVGVSKFQAFLAIKPVLKGKFYWYALRQAYDLSDNLFLYRTDVKLAFCSDDPFREFLMNCSERKVWAKLPPRVTIYRGMTAKELEGKIYGVSWTLSRQKAEYFARQYPRNYAVNHLEKVVHKKVVSKNKIVAFFNERLEEEIIYIDKHPLKGRRSVKFEPADQYEMLNPGLDPFIHSINK